MKIGRLLSLNTSAGRPVAVDGGVTTALAKHPVDGARGISMLGIESDGPADPPAHGGQVVAKVLTDPVLRPRWEAEVVEMRTRIQAMRKSLHEVLSARLPGRDLSYFLTQRGMFSYTGMTPEQVDRLREEFGVYLIRSGRMCVAGLNSRNVQATAAAFAQVLK